MDAFCYRLDEHIYCPRCVREAACYLSAEEPELYDGFAAHWEVQYVRQRGKFTERTVRLRENRNDKAADTRKGAK